MGTNPSREALFRSSAGCCTKQRKSYLCTRQHFFFFWSYGHLSCLGSHAKSLGGQRAEICHLLSSRLMHKQHWRDLQSLPLLTSCVWSPSGGREGCRNGSTGRKTSHSSREEFANIICSFLFLLGGVEERHNDMGRGCRSFWKQNSLAVNRGLQDLV